MENMLIKYIRDRKRRPVGVVVALSPHKIGYSLCNVKEGDFFTRELAFELAILRAKNEEVTLMNVMTLPHTVRATVIQMMERSKKYFKQYR